MEEIRLGTMGSSAIVRSILDNVKVTEGIRLVAVYSRSEEKGRALASEYGASLVYTDMDAFFKEEAINFVYIATPNTLHYEQTKKALLAGKNVILEKPFCTRTEQARELVALARERGLFLVDATPTSFLPNYEVLRRELPKIGKVKLVHANYSQYSRRYVELLRGEIPNNFNPEYGGGCLMDINYYNVYLNVALFGKPREAVYFPVFYKDLADSSGALLMTYDGFVSNAVGAKDAYGISFFQIEGEKGYIYVENGSNGFAGVRVVIGSSEEVFNEQGDYDRLYFEIGNITRLVLADDYDALYRRLDTMLDAIEILEISRKKAGILFPGD